MFFMREKYLQICEMVDDEKVDIASTVIDEDAPLEDDVVRSLRTSPIHSGNKDCTSVDDFEIIKPISRDEAILRELRRAVNRHLDAMNLEVDDVRAGQMDISHMVADLKNHLVSLQGVYVKMVFKDNKRKKLMSCVGNFGVVCASVVTYLVFK
ncbi:unnamed protein product [Lactuca saligna]|uniref:Uncharacterized protein n=1 Tax=Lactuca saligna TaxID=75948 RepID=A0AA35Y962_LACSI|nr:unnamed protein product [Lactuca saligna]